jgi:hypothetical protein
LAIRSSAPGAQCAAKEVSKSPNARCDRWRDQNREQERRDRHDPDPGQPVEQVVGAVAGREPAALEEAAGDQDAAQHEKADHRLVAEPGCEEERPDRQSSRPGDIRAPVADRVQSEMAEQDQERGQPADVVERRAKTRREPRPAGLIRVPQSRSRS